ncbi:MAG TPA: TetR/AcrR family transcriptional regulator [Dehalococcoidia bacterium]|nr:TetR/AcrR family transcriptional regulator [Dehalococcoidia bacterium]
MPQKIVRAERADGIRSRQTILDAAAKLATVEGLAGLSIGGLAEHIGMSKSGLYAHFGSKEELQLATVHTAGQLFEADVIEPTLSIENPLDRFRAVCESFLGYVESRVFPGGCFFVAAAAEFDTHPGPVQTRIAEFVAKWMAGLTELLTVAQERGLIDAEEDPAQLAFEIDAWLIFANLNFVMSNSPEPLQRARRAMNARLAQAQPAASKRANKQTRRKPKA